MDLNYYLDLLTLCNASAKQIEAFFRFAFDVMNYSSNNKEDEIKEHFFKDDNALINGKNKSGTPLNEVIFRGSGEVANWIIPVVLKSFMAAKDFDNVPFGKISDRRPQLHPNAKIITSRIPHNLWELYEKDHYNSFRDYHITQKIYSKDCEKYFHKHLPNIVLTKKAIEKFKTLGRNDKETIISDLRKLNEFIDTTWKKGDFPIVMFSDTTGVAASDETKKTKNDPDCQRERLFSIPGIGSIYCFLHIKISNTYRIHFYPNSIDRKVYIPYIGKHLKTASFRG